MKYFEPYAIVIIALLCVLVFNSCASVPFDRAAYNTIKGLTVTVKVFVKSAKTAHDAKAISDEDWKSIDDKWKDYQVASDSAVIALRAATSGEDITKVIDDLSAMARKLMDYVRSKGVSP